MKRSFKKALAIIIVFVMIFVSSQELWSFDVSAAEYSGVCGDNLTWTLDDTMGELVISGTGDMYNWSYSSMPWYSYRSYIKSVTIGNGVTSIGDWAFYSCDGLTSVTIGDSVTSIGDFVFDSCDSLTSVTIGSSVTSIGSYAFASCGSLTSVTIGNSVTSIGYRAFDTCHSLTSVTIPDSVTSIGDWAFYSCDSLTSITVDENNAYYSSDEYGVLFNKDKTELIQYPIGNERTSYTIPDSVTSIGEGAFYDCNSLTSVTIPDSVTSIGYDAFAYCSSLTSITVNKNNAYYSSDEYGVLFNKDKTELIQYPIGNTRTSYTIPDSVTIIGNWAFGSCTSLASVTIPDSVTSIGDYVFYDCANLTSVTIGNSVTSIGDYAFYGCGNLTSVTIPDSVTSIGGSAFEDCDSLTSVMIPDSVTSIGDSAFYSCYSLTTAYYSGTYEQWQKISIGRDNSNLTSVLICESNSDRPYYLPGTCGDTLSYTLYADGELVISGTGDMTDWPYSSSAPWHSKRSSIKSVTIGNGVTSIGDWAFYSYDGLTSVTIGDSVTSIGDYAFYDCANLTSITVDENNTYYSSDEYGVLFNKDKTELIQYPNGNERTSYTIPDSVTSIGVDAFYYCTSLTSITISDSVTSIGYMAFACCDNLTSVMIPDSVTNIGDSAFYACYSLTTAYYSGTYEQWQKITVGSNNYELTATLILDSDSERPYRMYGTCGDSLNWILYADGELVISGMGNMTDWSYDNDAPWYRYRSSIKSMTISDSITNIGDYAFSGCNNLTSIEIPDSVTSIGDYAFYGCGNLTSVTIPDSVTSIGERAFYSCSGLMSIVIPDSVTSIGERAFSDTAYYNDASNWENGVLYIGKHLIEAETSISGAYTIKNGTLTIADFAFSGCAGLASIEIPDSVTNIGDGAFVECTNLTNITIPNSVASIGYGAFYFCSSLTNINIPASVTNIEIIEEVGSPFALCLALENITVDENNSYYSSVDGVLFDKSKKELIQYPLGNTRTNYTIPNSVTVVGYMSFFYCTNLTSVTIPDSVTSIGVGAFYCCNGLTSVTIGNSVTSIGLGAFQLCENLTEITIPGSVTSIGDFAFSECKSLTDIYYDGTKEQWNTVSIGTNNDSLFNATIHFLATGTFIINGGIAHPGETVKVTVSISDNPGFVSALLKIGYDTEKLTLVSVENGEIFANGDFEKGNDLSAMPYTVLWLDATAKEDYTADGKLLTLTFKVADDAPEGNTEISINYDEKSTFNAELQPVSFTVENGTVTIKNRIPGDANGDDELNLKDVVAIRRSLAGGWGIEIDESNADVDGSGDVNLVDAALITRFLADWDVTLV